MMNFAAHSIGPLVDPADFDGLVTGVFDQTCNIRLTDDSRMTCATAEYFNMPRGIIVRTPEDFKFNTNIRGGMTASCRSGVLKFSGSDLQIDLREALVWRDKFRPIAHPQQKILAKLWRDTVAQISPIIEFSYSHFEFLLLKNNMANLVDALIGRGPGLTPVGDDILTGLLAAPMLIAPENPSSQNLTTMIKNSATATTDISRQMLTDAASGYFIEPIMNLISALYTQGDFERPVKELQSIGSSSGCAMVLGILAGIAKVENLSLDQMISPPDRRRVA